MSELTLGDVFSSQARHRGAATALVADGATLTFRDVDDRACRLAGALHTEGVIRGGRVAYLGKNAAEYVVLLAACAKVGAVMVPLNWRLAVPELIAILADAGAQLVVVDDEFTTTGEAVLAASALSVRVRVVSTTDRDWPAWYRDHPPAVGHQGVGPGDVILQLYTSGTTGRPKGVLSTHEGVLDSVRLLAEVAGLAPAATSLCTLPIFHIGGTSWTLAGLVTGCATVLMRDVDAQAILSVVAAQQVTNMIAVPAVIQLLVEADADDPGRGTSLQRLYYGGGPMTGPVLERALEALDCEFVQGFGMTELPLILALEADLHSPGSPLLLSCGRVVRDTEARIVDPDTGRDVGVGVVGELWARASRTMTGYWNQPHQTTEALTPDGWLRTGDAMHVDADGFYFLHDRIKDVIISGGENIYSAEVENVLMAHPGVLECAIIGVPSPRWTETVKAIIVLRPGECLDDGELIEFCRGRLARYKCPTSVDIVRSLPRTPAGKVRKSELRRPFWPQED
jgi:long-chain acyl-CoA synthetase